MTLHPFKDDGHGRCVVCALSPYGVATPPPTLPITTTAELATDAIRKYSKLLGLESWDIRLSTRPLKGDLYSATVEIRYGAKVAVIRLHPDVVTSDHIEADVVHELAHLVHKDYTMLVCNVLAKHGDSALGVIDMLQEMEERICDAIAFGLTGHRFQPVGKYERKCFAVFDEAAA